MIGAVFMLGTVVASAAPVPSVCALEMGGKRWSGSCPALIDGANATMSIAPAAAIVSGAWRRDATPTGIWAGTVATAEYPASPVELEVYRDRRGVLRSAFGWFYVTHFTKAAASLRFDVDVSREVAASAMDREIIQRADRLLSSAATWNRADDRQCPLAATSWSIYCAMEKATIEVSGAFHHRRPALQVVRAIVDERTAGRPYEHRLMDYNNDATTTLGDVHGLFAEALARIGTH